MNALRKYADAAQTPHIGFDMHRVDALLIDINVEGLRQRACAGSENVMLKIVLRNDVSIIP